MAYKRLLNKKKFYFINSLEYVVNVVNEIR